MIIIQKAEEKDIKAIIELKLLLYKKWNKIDLIDKINTKKFSSNEHYQFVKNQINNKTHKIFLAFENNICIGFINCEICQREIFLEKTGYISELYIHKTYRKKGIGTKLIKKAIEWFKQNKIQWSNTSTHSLDIEAISFWKNKGYIEYNKFFKNKI